MYKKKRDPCYHENILKNIFVNEKKKRQKSSIMQSTKKLEEQNDSNDTFRHDGAVRLFNSLLPSHKHEKDDFSLPFVRVNKNMKILSFPTWLCCECCLLFNDDSPIQMLCSYVYRFFNISPHHHHQRVDQVLHGSRDCGWHFAVSNYSEYFYTENFIFLFRLILSALHSPLSENKVFL